ncbi:MAG: hypothetical protein ACLSE4_13540 [Clostridium sp.]
MRTPAQSIETIFLENFLFGGIGTKEDEPGKEGIQGRKPEKKADYQNEGKKTQGNGFHKNTPLYKWGIMGILTQTILSSNPVFSFRTFSFSMVFLDLFYEK